MFLERINDPSDLRALSKEDLPVLADELRAYILEVVSKNGGHLGAALGAIELTLALHRVFETPQDTIVWDVGHQAHAHKILTGRREAFKTFRQDGGLSGFSNKDESTHDPFTTGHAATSISTGLGVSVANKLLGRPARKAVAVIGDASLVSGMAFEALNHAGHLKDNLIVILNDNEMSISPTVGALSRYLNKIITNPVYNHLRKDFQHFVESIPKVGKKMIAQAKRFDEGFKNLFVPGLFFEELGFRYFGPLDGHNLQNLVGILENVKKIEGPVLLHVLTKKGKGYKIAESDPMKWHASTPFCIETGSLNSVPKSVSYMKTFGKTAQELARHDSRIVAITAAMCEGTGLVDFAKEFPERFFDVGIAEEHGVSFAAGLAKAGARPLVAIYSTFLQRAHDQIIHDVALQNLPVAFCLDRAGLVGEDGPTHHGAFDIAYLRKVPGMAVMAPRDGRELSKMVEFAADHRTGPIAVRYPRGPVAEETGACLPAGMAPLAQREPAPIALGRSEILKEGSDVLLLAFGSEVYPAYEAAGFLEKDGVSAAVVNARFAKPLDEETILNQARGKKLVVMLEEGCIPGGFGEAVLELLERRMPQRPAARILGIPDKFIEHGKRERLLDKIGLSAPKIREEVLKQLRAPNVAPADGSAAGREGQKSGWTTGSPAGAWRTETGSLT